MIVPSAGTAAADGFQLLNSRAPGPRVWAQCRNLLWVKQAWTLCTPVQEPVQEPQEPQCPQVAHVSGVFPYYWERLGIGQSLRSSIYLQGDRQVSGTHPCPCHPRLIFPSTSGLLCSRCSGTVAEVSHHHPKCGIQSPLGGVAGTHVGAAFIDRSLSLSVPVLRTSVCFPVWLKTKRDRGSAFTRGETEKVKLKFSGANLSYAARGQYASKN